MLKFSCMLYLYSNVWDKFKLKNIEFKKRKGIKEREGNRNGKEYTIQRKIYTYIPNYDSS
jgi:hypothetical protein